ncbi:MAG: hypothetical protein KAS32_28765 [Candidatus Peribacteraceae bacterium]|nr:hypothetical protein [Candidatus Peribacteraceae bacterium]
MNKLKIIQECTACDLYKNQVPVIDNRDISDVFWVGISGKLNISVPLDISTLSGKLIANIEAELPDTHFYATNLVKCSPLDSDGKLRYPKSKEIQACMHNLNIEMKVLKPRIAFLLGKLVSDRVLKNLGIQTQNFGTDFKYKAFNSDGITYIPIHHPSYVARFKRCKIGNYKEAIIDLITNVLKLQ